MPEHLFIEEKHSLEEKKYKKTQVSVTKMKIISLQSSKSFEFRQHRQRLPNEYLNVLIIKMGLYKKVTLVSFLMNHKNWHSLLFKNNPLNFEHMVHLPTNTKTFLIL